MQQLGHSTANHTRIGQDDVYLPAFRKTSSLNSIKGALSQSCPYLYDNRRGSFSSVASQRNQSNPKTQVIGHLCRQFSQSRVLLILSLFQSFLRGQREARKSNVAVTMTYLGQGRRGSGLGPTQDELKILQQVNGGENICVFKGLVFPGGTSYVCKAFFIPALKSQ